MGSPRETPSFKQPLSVEMEEGLSNSEIYFLWPQPYTIIVRQREEISLHIILPKKKKKKKKKHFIAYITNKTYFPKKPLPLNNHN